LAVDGENISILSVAATKLYLFANNSLSSINNLLGIPVCRLFASCLMCILWKAAADDDVNYV